MFHIGTQVKVNAGEHHGKRGEVTGVNMTGSGDRMRVELQVTLEPGLVISGLGPDFTPVARVHN